MDTAIRIEFAHPTKRSWTRTFSTPMRATRFWNKYQARLKVMAHDGYTIRRYLDGQLLAELAPVPNPDHIAAESAS